MPEFEKKVWEKWGRLMPNEGDLGAFLKGWQVLIKDKLYYDPRTQQYYGRNHQVMSYSQVQSRHDFDPMKPQDIYKGTAQISPRTAQITQWQPTEGVPPEAPPTEPTEQEELERLATQMGISVQDLLRYQYGVPVEEPEVEKGLTAWQEAQLGLQKQQGWWDLQRQREMTQQAQYGYGQQRMAHQMRGLGSEFGAGWTPPREGEYGANPPAILQPRMAEMWRTWQNRLAGGASWPQSEILRTQRNPYEKTPESIGDEMQQSKREWEFAKEKADWFRKRQKDPDDPLTAGSGDYFDIGAGVQEQWSPDQQAAYGAFLGEAVARRQYESMMTGREAQDWSDWKGRQEKSRATAEKAGWGGDYGRDLPSRQPPPMPETPAFLRGVYPELGARLPRDKEQAPMYPLSGQQWTQMLPSQRGKWAGYIGWAGGKPEDLYAQMEQMTPRYKRGPTWSPARQV